MYNYIDIDAVITVHGIHLIFRIQFRKCEENTKKIKENNNKKNCARIRRTVNIIQFTAHHEEH